MPGRRYFDCKLDSIKKNLQRRKCQQYLGNIRAKQAEVPQRPAGQVQTYQRCDQEGGGDSHSQVGLNASEGRGKDRRRSEAGRDYWGRVQGVGGQVFRTNNSD